MTYPSLSNKHYETVCTAGFKEDGSWIRIFPVPYRLMIDQFDNQIYNKWQWIEVDLEQNLAHDDRPESYHIKNIDTLKTLNRIDVYGHPKWSLRKEWVFKNKDVFDNLDNLITLTNKNELSLAVLKPTEIISMTYTKEDPTKYKNKLKELKARYEADKMQTQLFESYDDINSKFEFAEKIPYKFKYKFKTTDGKIRNLMVEDWEIGMLYRKVFYTSHDESKACQDVINKYMGFAKNNDVYFFLGTSYEWQKKNADDPYMIIGVFYPPKPVPMPLFPNL
jgi:hypothetical protein